MNYSVLPDFVAIGGLVAVFHSLLRRTRQSRLRMWLLGWVLLLVHIVAQFVSQNLPDDAGAAVAISVAMLLLASVAFLWAGAERQPARAWRLHTVLVGAAPDVALVACLVYGVDRPWLYAALTAAGAVASLWLSQGGRRRDDRRLRPVPAASVLAAYLVQAALFVFGHADMVLVWTLCWHYLAVAAVFRAGAPQATVGVRFTTLSFVAWALVFPAGYAMAIWLPHVRVEAEVWNLPKFLVATGMIFTLLEEQLARAEHASLHDALTGLPNRRLFARRLQAALAEAAREGTRLALLVIDLDDFKRINDTHGHAVGDALLQHVAAQLRRRLRGTDTLARLGGDEFAVLLTDVADRAAAEALTGSLQVALRQGAELDGEILRVSASFGVSLYPDDADAPTGLYAAADRTMYARKPARPERAPLEPAADDLAG